MNVSNFPANGYLVNPDKKYGLRSLLMADASNHSTRNLVNNT